MKQLNYTSVITRPCIFGNLTDKQMTLMKSAHRVGTLFAYPINIDHQC